MASVLEKSAEQFMNSKYVFCNRILASKKSNVIRGANYSDYASALLVEPEGKILGYSWQRVVQQPNLQIGNTLNPWSQFSFPSSQRTTGALRLGGISEDESSANGTGRTSWIRPYNYKSTGSVLLRDTPSLVAHTGAAQNPDLPPQQLQELFSVNVFESSASFLQSLYKCLWAATYPPLFFEERTCFRFN